MTDIVTIHGLDEFEAQLKRLGDKARSEKILDSLEAGGRVIQIYAQDNVRTKLNRHPTGNLVNNIDVRKEGKIILVGAWGTVYAKIHEFGGVITPIKAKMLHFFVDGVEVFAKRVSIPARPYLRPAVDEHMPEIEQAVSDAMRGLLEEAL